MMFAANTASPRRFPADRDRHPRSYSNTRNRGFVNGVGGGET